MLVGIVAGELFALLLGTPTLRLRADYLTIATIATAEGVRLLFVTELFKEWTNSAGGLSGYHAGFRDANPFPLARTALARGPRTRTTCGFAYSA